MLSSIGWNQLTAAQQQKIPAEYQNKDIPISVIEDSGIELSATQKSIFNETSVQKDVTTYKVTDYETEPRDTSSFWNKAAEIGKKVLVGSGVGIAAGLVASLAFPVWGAVTCGILAGVGAYMFASKKAREAKQKAQQSVPQYQAPINKPEQKVADTPKEEEKPIETKKAEEPVEKEKPKPTPKAEKPVEEKKPAETPKEEKPVETKKAEEPAQQETVVEKTVIEPLNYTPEQAEELSRQSSNAFKDRYQIEKAQKLSVSELTPELREIRIEHPRSGSKLSILQAELKTVEELEAKNVGASGYLPSASKIKAQIEEIMNADKKEKELKERISELETEVNSYGETKWYNFTKNSKKRELENLKNELENLY
ncbi:MAG: hypothetical protein MJ229_04355 [bacterium]|nr:hypothetical protein [bacterium]